MTQVTLAISSPTALKKYGSGYDTHPVGTGPFKFQQFINDEKVVVTRNPDRPGLGLRSDHHQAAAEQPHRGLRTPLHAGGAGQGLLRVGPAVAARDAQRDRLHRHHRWPAGRVPAGRRGGHRGDLREARAGQLPGRAHPGEGRPSIQGVVLLVAVTYLVVNLLVDIAHALLDPRIRQSWAR